MTRKWISVALILSFTMMAHAAGNIKMNFKDEDILKAVEAYSKATGQKIVVDPSVHGKITILAQEPLAPEEAFNQLSSALATNGYAFSRQDDTLILQAARHVQRSLIDTGTELPPLKPQRMFTYIYKAKYIPVEQVNRDLRIMSSRDGEMSTFPANNQLIFTDWVSNLYRIQALMKELDKPAEGTAKK
jgi:general secretion pathway protein D